MIKRVLVADDDQSMRTLMLRAFLGIGVSDVTEAADGEEALELCRENQFDVIVLDQDMPGKTGLAVTRAIRAGGSEAPILMVTAEADRKRVLEALQAGVSDYLVKPFDNDVLKDKLTTLCHADEMPSSVAFYRARNVMTKGVVTVRENDTVEVAMRTLLEHSISGLPVVADPAKLVGIITEHRLVQLIYSPELKDEKIYNHMTEDVLTATEETDLSDVAHMMEQNRIRRVPVVRNGQVVGIVARRDLLRYVLENEEALKEFLAAAKRPVEV